MYILYTCYIVTHMNNNIATTVTITIIAIAIRTTATITPVVTLVCPLSSFLSRSVRGAVDILSNPASLY